MKNNERVLPIQWWSLEHFRGRSNKVTTFDIKNGEKYITEQIDSVPDDVIICDDCNADIKTFPVPVVGGHALCVKCRTERYGISPGDDEYFETFEYMCLDAPPQLGTTHGGRRSGRR